MISGSFLVSGFDSYLGLHFLLPFFVFLLSILSIWQVWNFRGSTVGLLLLQHFRVDLLLSTCLVSSQWWILIYMFAVLIHWWVEVLHPDLTTSMCIWTTAESRMRLLQCKTGLSPPVIYYWPFQGVLLLWFILIVNVCLLSVCLWLNVQFI